MKNGKVQLEVGLALALPFMTMQAGAERDGQARSVKVKASEERIVWGKTIGGLQGGLSYKGGSSRFRVGDTVALNLYWRNVTKAPVTISYGTHPGSAFRPTVWTRSGRRVPMEVALVIAREETTTLEPGQTISVAPLTMVLTSVRNRETDDLLPKYAVSPGRYTVNVDGNEKDSSVPTSGSLEFTIVKK